MNRILIAFIGSVLLFAAFAYVLFREGQPASVDGERPIMLFCAASNRAVMEAIRADYENEFHRRVEIQYGPSQTLLSSIEVSKSGDLYLPADDSYLTMATDKALVEEILPIARMQGVIAVQTGNPKSIESLSDLVGSTSNSFKPIQTRLSLASWRERCLVKRETGSKLTKPQRRTIQLSLASLVTLKLVPPTPESFSTLCFTHSTMLSTSSFLI